MERHMLASRRVLASIIATVALLSWSTGVASAQSTAGDCQPFTLNGTVLECAAAGSPLNQLRTGTFIAGSEAAGETLARAIALEVATAPFGSSSGGFTFTFDPSTRAFSRRTGTFGPAFSERALTIGKGKLSGGFNFLHRSYDRMDGLTLSGFEVFRFQGGTLPVTSSRLELETRTNTLAGFADYGVLDNFDVGVLVPYVRISVKGVSRIFGQSNDELQRVLVNASAAGLGDIAIFGKYRFWTLKPSSAAGELEGGLAAAVTLRVPSGDADNLVGLGVTRTLFSLVGSTTVGRISPHLNVGYEAWSGEVAIPKDFQGRSTIGVKDQVQYSGGLEYEVHPQLSLMFDVLGRYLRGGGRVGYQPFAFPQNFANVSGAEALVAIPSGMSTVLVAPGAKWNVVKSALLTMNVLVSLTDNGLRTRLTPVIGIDWGF
jgi:hypothetical protein